MGGKGALNYLPIVPKASIWVPKVMPFDKILAVLGWPNNPGTFTYLEGGKSSKTGPDSQNFTMVDGKEGRAG